MRKSMVSDDVFEKLKIFNSFIKERARAGQPSSALTLKKEHMAHIREALSKGDITQEQYDALIGELELMGDEEPKRCPRCDTAVRENAKVCFKCGFAFEELISPEKKEPFFEIPVPQPNPKPEYKQTSSKNYLIVGIVAFILIVSLGIFAALLIRGVIPTYGELISRVSPQESLTPTFAPATFPPQTPPPIAAPPSIAISKIQAIATNPTQEYIEIYNTTKNTLDVTGWIISDNQGNVFTFHRFFLQPGRRVKIYTGTGSDTLLNLHWGLSTFVWDDSGDTITVKDAQGNLVIQVTY
jgi:hypothetical protein